MDINVSTLVSYNLIFIVAISIDISEHFLLWKQIKKEARNDQASEALIKRRYPQSYMFSLTQHNEQLTSLVNLSNIATHFV